MFIFVIVSSALQVVGCAKALKIDKHWKNLIDSSRERHRLYKVYRVYPDLNATLPVLEYLKSLLSVRVSLRTLLLFNVLRTFCAWKEKCLGFLKLFSATS